MGETGGKLIISNDQRDQNSGEEEKFETRNERKHCNSLRRCQRRNLNTSGGKMRTGVRVK